MVKRPSPKALGQANPWGPQPIGSGQGLSSTAITVLAVLGTDLAPLAGVRVEVHLVFWDAAAVTTRTVLAAEGVTDGQGRYTFQHAPVPAGSNFRLRSAPEGYKKAESDAPSGTRTTRTLVLCPTGTDPLVCEVAEKQMFFADQLRTLNAAWGGPSPFTIDNARALLEDHSPPRDGRLRARWVGEYSWFLTDLAIPPSDWPKLVENYEFALSVFNEIPFPETGGTDWFRRCAYGVPVWRGKDGKPLSLASFRIYSPTWSDYFPRSKRQIRMDLAARYALNIPAIVKCMVHKLGKKTREVERTARTMSTLGLATAFMLGPMAGAAGVANAVTELGTFAYQMWGLSGSSVEVGGSVVSDGLFTGTEPGLEVLIAGGLTALVAELAKDADPRVTQVAQQAIPIAVDATYSDAQNAVLSGGATDFLSLQGLGSAAAVAAIRLLVSSMKAVGARSAEELKDIVFGFKNLDEDALAFVIWCMDRLLIDSLFEAAEEELRREEEEDLADSPAPAPDGGGAETPSPSAPAAASGAGFSLDPASGQVLENGVPTPLGYDPRTGLVFDPTTHAILDPDTGGWSGLFHDPRTGAAVRTDGTPVPEDVSGRFRLSTQAPSKLATVAAVGGAGLLAALAVTGIIS